MLRSVFIIPVVVFWPNRQRRKNIGKEGLKKALMDPRLQEFCCRYVSGQLDAFTWKRNRGIAAFARLGNSPPQLAVLWIVSHFELFNACKFQVDIHDSFVENRLLTLYTGSLCTVHSSENHIFKLGELMNVRTGRTINRFVDTHETTSR